SLSEAEKKEGVAQLEAALTMVKPIQFKENIALVLKYFDQLIPFMQEMDTILFYWHHQRAPLQFRDEQRVLVDKSWNAAVLEDFADYRAGVKIPTLGPADLGAMDKGPFSSLVTGRASRSSSHTLTIREVP